MLKKCLSLLLALTLAASCFPAVIHAEGSVTAMHSGAEGLPEGSVLCFPDENTKWHVLDGSRDNTGEDGMFLLSDTADGSADFLQPYKNGPIQKYCSELYGKLFSPELESVIKKTTKTDESYNGCTRYVNVLENDALFALSYEEFARYSDYITNLGLTWALRSHMNSTIYYSVGKNGSIETTGKFNPTDVAYTAVRPAFNLDKSKVMLFIPTSMSEISQEPAQVPLTAEQYRPLIAAEQSEAFTAQTVQTDSKTLTVSYSGAVSGDDSCISAAIINSDGAYTYYGKIKVTGTDTAGTAAITIPDGVNPDTDTLCIFNEQSCFASKLQRVCISHKFEISDKASDEHTFLCRDCGFSYSEPHDFDYTYTDSTHTGTCSVCGASSPETAHSLTTVDNGDGTHTTSCSVCPYTYTAAHSLTYTDNGDGRHKKTCSDCGYSAFEYHNSIFVYDSSKHTEKCADCDSVIFWDYHKLKFTDNEDGLTHTAECTVSGCGYSEHINHFIRYMSYNNGSHNVRCSVCSYDKDEECDITITDNGDGTHTASCSECGYTSTVSHTYDYTDNGDGTHTAKCSVCGSTASVGHTYAYTDAVDGKSDCYCTVCNSSMNITAFDGAVIPAAGRDITNLVDKSSVVAATQYYWSTNPADNLFDNSSDGFAGYGENLTYPAGCLSAAFNLKKGAMLRGIQIWTGDNNGNYTTRNPNLVKLYAKENSEDDFEKVIEIPTINMAIANYMPFTYTFSPTDKPYKYFKVEFYNDNARISGTQIGELKLLGNRAAPVSFELEYVGHFGETETVVGEDFSCTLYAAGGHPSADKVKVLADGNDFTDYTYDTATGILKIDGANVSGATYTIRAVGEKFSPNVTANVNALRFKGDKTAQIGTDYTAVLTDSRGGTANLPQSIRILIGGTVLGEDYYSYDPATGKITISGATIFDSVTIEASAAYKLSVLGDEITADKVSGSVSADGCSGSWSFDADSNTLTLEGFTGTFVNNYDPLIRYTGSYDITVEFSDCSITSYDYIVTSAGSPATVTVVLSGNNTLNTPISSAFCCDNISIRADGTSTVTVRNYVVPAGISITGSGSLEMDSLDSPAMGDIVYYGAKKPTKSAVYMQSYLAYKNGVITPGAPDLYAGSYMVVKNGVVDDFYFAQAFKDNCCYENGVLTFRDGASLSDVNIRSVGDIRYLFEGSAALSSSDENVFEQLSGNISFEAAEGADVSVRSDYSSAVCANNDVSFSGAGKITIASPNYDSAIRTDSVLCKGKSIDVTGKSSVVYDGSLSTPLATSSPLSSLMIYTGSSSYDALNDPGSLPAGVSCTGGILTVSGVSLTSIAAVGDVSIVLDNASVGTLSGNNISLTLKNSNSAQSIVAYALAVNAENGTLSLDSYDSCVLNLDSGVLTVDGEVIDYTGSETGYISYKNAVFGVGATYVNIGGTLLSADDAGSYLDCTELGWVLTSDKNAQVYFDAIEKPIGETTVTTFMIKLNNVDAAAVGECFIYCNGDLEVVLEGENKISSAPEAPEVSAPPSRAATKQPAPKINLPAKATIDTYADDGGSELPAYGSVIRAYGSLTISGTGSLNAVPSENSCFEHGISARSDLTVSGVKLDIDSSFSAINTDLGKLNIANGSVVSANCSDSAIAVDANGSIFVTDSELKVTKSQFAIESIEGSFLAKNSSIVTQNSYVGIITASGNVHFDGGSADISGSEVALSAYDNITFSGGAQLSDATVPSGSFVVRLDGDAFIGLRTYNPNTYYWATRVVIESDPPKAAYVSAVSDADTVRITADPGVNGSGVLVVACYTEDRLSAIKTLPIRSGIDTTAAELGIIPGSADKLRAMLWRDLKTMYPLCDSAEADLSSAQ